MNQHVSAGSNTLRTIRNASVVAVSKDDHFADQVRSVLEDKGIKVQMERWAASSNTHLFEAPNVDLLAVDYLQLAQRDSTTARWALGHFAAPEVRNSKLLVCDQQTVDLVQSNLKQSKIDRSEWERINSRAISTAAMLEDITQQWADAHADDQAARLPRVIYLPLLRQEVLRYGENPHQSAALYRDGFSAILPLICSANKVQGKQLSFNNISDADAAYSLVTEFDPGSVAAVAIIKHANPSGVGQGKTLVAAYRKALESDRESAFGGVIALNKPLDAATAEEISQIFTEVIVAPGASVAARKLLSAKPNIRLVLTNELPTLRASDYQIKSVSNGYLVQTNDVVAIDRNAWKVKTERAPTDREWADLEFAWKVAKHVKSNAIVFAKGGGTVGVGAGQMSRVDSARIAAQKGGAVIQGSVVASDAFLPFPDALIVAAEAGATALVQPGGSVRDNEVISKANEKGMAMVFTDVRHFRH